MRQNLHLANIARHFDSTSARLATAAQSNVLFFLQMAAILATCRAVGWIAKRFLVQSLGLGPGPSGFSRTPL